MQGQLAWLALDLAATAAECHTVDQLRLGLFPPLAEAVGAEMVIYHQINLRGNVQEYGVAWPDDTELAQSLASYPAVAQHSPLVHHFAGPFAGEVVSLRQLVSARQWHENALYRESHRHLGIEDQLALSVAMRDGRGHAVTLGRSRGNFDPEQRDLLALLSPHIRAAIRRSLRSSIPYRVIRTFPDPTWTWQIGPALLDAGEHVVLTPREMEVLSLAGAGHTTRSLARLLGIAPRTVDKHLENAFRKLDATCRRDAVDRLKELGTGFGTR